jgi:hypothetical protein
MDAARSKYCWVDLYRGMALLFLARGWLGSHSFNFQISDRPECRNGDMTAFSFGGQSHTFMIMGIHISVIRPV